MATKNTFVPRVNQLDAIQLDADVLQLLRESFIVPLQNYVPSICIKYQPELDLILQSAVWCCSIGRKMTSFGQELLLICYDKDQLTTSRLCLHFLLTVIPKYIKSNAEQRFISNELLSKIVPVMENATLILSVMNFFRFLKTGKKPTLIDFLLGLDYVTIHGGKRREIGYKYMTRELLWGGFMELLGIVLPLINFEKLRRLVKNLFHPTKSLQPGEIIHPRFDVNTTCVFCKDRPTLPHHMGCGHVFCYYCLKANLLSDPEFSCPECNCKKVKIMPLEIKNRS